MAKEGNVVTQREARIQWHHVSFWVKLKLSPSLGCSVVWEKKKLHICAQFQLGFLSLAIRIILKDAGVTWTLIATHRACLLQGRQARTQPASPCSSQATEGGTFNNVKKNISTIISHFVPYVLKITLNSFVYKERHCFYVHYLYFKMTS